MDKLLLGILGIAILISLLTYSGYSQLFDDSGYIQLANNSLQGNLSLSTPLSFGYAYIYTLAIWIKLFGTQTLPILSLIEFLSLIVLSYYLAKRLTNDIRIAQLTSAIMAITPFILEYATRTLYDYQLGIMATLALYFLFSEKKIDILLAGILAGAMIFIKLNSIAFILPFSIIILLTKGKQLAIIPKYIVTALFFIPFLPNILYPILTAGIQQTIISPSSFLKELTIMFTMLNPIGNLDYQIYGLGILLWIALISTILLSKDELIRKLSILVWGYFFLMLFAPVNIFSYPPLTINTYQFGVAIPRYLITIAPILSLLVSIPIIKLYDKLKQSSLKLARLALATIFIFLIVSNIVAYNLIANYNHLIYIGKM